MKGLEGVYQRVSWIIGSADGFWGLVMFIWYEIGLGQVRWRGKGFWGFGYYQFWVLVVQQLVSWDLGIWPMGFWGCGIRPLGFGDLDGAAMGFGFRVGRPLGFWLRMVVLMILALRNVMVVGCVGLVMVWMLMTSWWLKDVSTGWDVKEQLS